jgi:hypothetical protein
VLVRVLTVACLLLVGCSGEQQSSPTSVRDPLVASVDAPSEFPVEREWREQLGLSAVYDLDALRYNEYQRRVASCMKERGFEYLPASFLEASVRFNRLINPLNEKTAAQYGYHRPDVATAEVNQQASSPAFDLALNGPEEDAAQGCARPAFGLVQSMVSAAFAAVQAMLDSLDEAADGYFESEDGMKTLTQWSTCMNDRGFDFRTQHDGIDRYVSASVISDDELRARSSDLDCDRQTQLTSSRSRWERGAFEAWLAQNGPGWDEVLIKVDTAMSAVQVLADENLH